MQETIIDPALECDKTLTSTELKFAKYLNNCESIMSESHKQQCSSSEFVTRMPHEQLKVTDARASSAEPSEKSPSSPADTSCINKSSAKNVDTFKSTLSTSSFDLTSTHIGIKIPDVGTKETLSDTRPSSNISNRSPTTNNEKYFPDYSSGEITEKDLSVSYRAKLPEALSGSHTTETQEEFPSSRTIRLSPVYNGSHGASTEPRYASDTDKLSDIVNNSNAVKKEKDITNHLSAGTYNSPVKALSEEVQQKVEHCVESCMKFAEVLYKCTLCTTLPSILTSKQSFLAHVRKQHLIEEMSRFSCKQCMLNFCTEEDLNFHQTTCHMQVNKASLSLSESSEESDSNDTNGIQMHGRSSKIMWCSETEHKSNSSKSNSYPKMFKPFHDSPESTSHGVPTAVSGSPKGQKPLELRRGVLHSAYPTNYKQNIYYPYNKFNSVDKNTFVNNFPLTGIPEIDKLTNQMVHPPAHNLGTMSTIGANLNSFTPEFGRYTKLVREGGNIVYFCQVCNWKCPVKTIFQTHCRGIQHQTKVQSADDSSGNSSNSPGPTPVSDTKSDKDLLKRGFERNPMNLCITEDSKTRILERASHVDSRRHGDSETERMSPHGNKSPLKSLLSSSHRVATPRSSPGVSVSRESFSDRPVTSMKYCSSSDFQIPFATQAESHTNLSATAGIKIPLVGHNAINLTADIIYSQCRNYEFSRGNYPFCNSPNKDYASRITSPFHKSANSVNKLPSCRNRRKRPAPVALRNQFSDSDTDSDLDVQNKKKDETYLGVTSKPKKQLSLNHSSTVFDMNLNQKPQCGNVTVDSIHRETTKVQSSTPESTHHSPFYYQETRQTSPSSLVQRVQPHDLSSHSNHSCDELKTTESLSVTSKVQIKQEPKDDVTRIAYTCSNCAFTTVFLDAYNDHMAKEHVGDVMGTSGVWRHSGNAISDRPDCLVGDHDEFATERTNVNSEGWKIVKIKAALPEIVQSSPSGNVSRDILLQKVSLVVNVPDVVQWGPACNKAVREVFPASSAQRKGKYKKTYFFGLEYVEQSTQGNDDSSDTENINYQPLRDMSHDLDLIIRFLPETLTWTGDMESGVTRDQLLEVLATKIRDPDIHHWGVQCNRAARMVFPEVQMRRKGKYKSVFYGVEFVGSLAKRMSNIMKPSRSLDQKSDILESQDDGIERNANVHPDTHLEKSSPRFQHHWHSNGKPREVQTAVYPNNEMVKEDRISPDLETSDPTANHDVENSETTEKTSMTLEQIAPSTPINTPDPDITGATFDQCSPKHTTSPTLTNGDDSLRQM